MNNVLIIIFGVTGDLAKRKLIPGLYQLVRNNHNMKYIVVGVAREQVTVEQLASAVRPYVGQYDEESWQSFFAGFYYQKSDLSIPGGYRLLAECIAHVESYHALSGNRIFYLAVAGHLFLPITIGLATYNLLIKSMSNQTCWHRIVYEKPFGHDLLSAHAINAGIAPYVNEDQVYRIDHYLTKELVNNIALIRFTNTIFEPLWNNRYVDHIQIVLAESLGIDGRGGYYDHYGALSDVVQNHVLELLALVTMESPLKLTAEYIREQRAKLLSSVHVVDGFLGQYEGYRNELDVAPFSTTETFAALKMGIDNERWSGVPIYIKSGKFLSQKETSIHILFKDSECRLIGGCPVASNWLTIRVTPNASWFLTINAKKPGAINELLPVNMEFCHSDIFGNKSPDEDYETLLSEVIRGEQSMVVRIDEIEESWRIIAEIKKYGFPLFMYERGTAGPVELKHFEHIWMMRWRS